MNHKPKAQRVSFSNTSIVLGFMLSLLMSVTAFQPYGVPALYIPSKVQISSSPLLSSSRFPSPISYHHTISMVSNTNNNNDSNMKAVARVDTSAIVKYFISLTTQVSLFSITFYTIDLLLHTYFQINAKGLPQPIICFLFYTISLKSRIFNPLNNSRPKTVKPSNDPSSATDSNTATNVKKGFNDRIMPKWTPPGFIFPIVWLLIISPLRATASTLLIQAQGHFFNVPIMSLILHLSIGDIWNTINNTERRYGTSVLGVVAVWISALHAAYQYYQISPLAGRLLGATCIWLTIAAALIGQTWRLNPSSIESTKKDPLLPMIVEGETSRTQFTWI